MSNWIENLKEGDLVIVENRFSSRIAKVEKITPSGLIKVEGTLYTKDGFVRGSKSDPWSINVLREATNDAIAEVRNNKLINDAKALMKSEKAANISAEQAKAIIEILEGKNSEKI